MAAAVTDSSRAMTDAVAAGTVARPEKNHWYASTVGTSPRYTSQATAWNTLPPCGTAPSTTAIGARQSMPTTYAGSISPWPCRARPCRMTAL
jgi:hypothetical protein